MKLLHLPRARALIALTVAFAAVAGIVWGNRGSGHAKVAAGQFVLAERGDVAITVGGVGHVSTLTGAARVAARALVSADALAGKQFGGRVLDVGLTGAEVGGVVNFPVIIALHSGGKLSPGRSVSARIIVRRRRDVVRVPLAAIVDGGVTVRGATGRLRRRQVRLGLRGAEFIEVGSGLRAGERVLVPTGGAWCFVPWGTGRRWTSRSSRRPVCASATPPGSSPSRRCAALT